MLDSPGPPVNLAHNPGAAKPYGSLVGSLTYPRLEAGARGMAHRFTSGAVDGWWVAEDQAMNITTQVSIVIGYEKADATARNSQAFGFNGAASRMLVHLPWSDGNLYWDFATGRVTLAAAAVAGYHVWGFTAGPRGMDVWRDGVKTNTAQFPTRSISNVGFHLGTGGVTSDEAWMYFCFLHRYQLPDTVMQQLTTDPYRHLVLPNIAGTYAGLPVTAAPAGAFPWLYYARMRS